MAELEKAFILCNNLVKVYRIGDSEILALQGLDLNVTQGELMGIVGPSGSGKSTLLNILGGLDRPTAGVALMNGQNLLKMTNASLDDYRKYQVGFVWQQTSRNLIPYLSAIENVELPMILAGNTNREYRTWARELLEAVGLSERRHHKLDQLSGGEQQRVAIAVALVNRPKLLLADEPTGEVDSSTALTILNIFRQLNATYGITIIIVTHDINISEHVDRVVSIRDGKTSMERIRHSDQSDEWSQGKDNENGQNNQDGAYHEYVVLDSAGRLQIPPEYREKLNIGDRVELDVNEEGILIRPVTGRGLELTEFQARDKERQLKAEIEDRSRSSFLGWLSKILRRRKKGVE